MSTNKLDEANTLWECILAIYGYCPGPEDLRNERVYHAIFRPAFHRSCFLSVHLSPTDSEAILTFGYFVHAWEWKKYLEILAAIRTMQGSSRYSEDTFASDKSRQGEILSQLSEHLPLLEEESAYISKVHMAAISSEALEQFERRMQEIDPFELATLMLEPQQARDGIAARGIVTEQARSHRFDIWPVPLTSRHRAFFLACISIGCACLEGAEQEQLKAVLSALTR